jgi:hypothetical protein
MAILGSGVFTLGVRGFCIVEMRSQENGKTKQLSDVQNKAALDKEWKETVRQTKFDMIGQRVEKAVLLKGRGRRRFHDAV